MSDPFPKLERTLGITRRLLEVLAAEKYPTIISTKGSLVAEDTYVNLLKQGDFAVQFSFATRDDRIAKDIERGAPSPTDRLRALRHLSNEGIPVAVRLQPYIPGREGEAIEFINEIAELGAAHIGVEHLKMPIESSPRILQMERSLKLDLRALYSLPGVRRDGREWVLPTPERLPPILNLRRAAHALGLSFGAADCDLLPLSDGEWCCSGADALLRGGNGFDCNYLGAVRRAPAGSDVTFDLLEDCWSPKGSIAMMVNSHSRIHGPSGCGAGVSEYIRKNWNGSPNGCSPAMFYGVEPTERRDKDGLRTYNLTSELQTLISQRLHANEQAGPCPIGPGESLTIK